VRLSNARPDDPNQVGSYNSPVDGPHLGERPAEHPQRRDDDYFNDDHAHVYMRHL
jgi:hypothetical protein